MAKGSYRVKENDSWWSLAEKFTGSGRNAARVRDFYRRKGIFKLHAGMRIPRARGISGRGGGRALAAMLGQEAGAQAQKGTQAAPKPQLDDVAEPPRLSPAETARATGSLRGVEVTPNIAQATGSQRGFDFSPPSQQQAAGSLRGFGLQPQGMGGGQEFTYIGEGASFQPQRQTGSRQGQKQTPGFFEVMGAGATAEGTDPITNAARQAAGLPPNRKASAIGADQGPTGILSGTFSPTSIARWQSIINSAQMGNPEELVGYTSVRVGNKIQMAVSSGNRNHLPETISNAVAMRIAGSFGYDNIQEFFDDLGYTQISGEVWAKNYETGVVGGASNYTYTSGYYSGARYSGSRGRRARRSGGGTNYGGNLLIDWNADWNIGFT